MTYHGFTAAAAALALVLASPRASAQASPHAREPAAAGSAITPAARTFDIRASSEVSLYADTNAVTVVTPTAAATVEDKAGAWSANGHYLADIVSAASVDIVSTASPRWTEVRHEAGVSATYKPGATGARLSAAVSREPDYLSVSGGGLLLLEMANKNFNPAFGYAFTSDTAGRTGTPFSVFSRQLQLHSFAAAAEVVLNRRSVLLLEADAVLELGDSSKPYRYLPLFAPDVAPSIQPGASLADVNQRRLPGRIGERVPGERLRLSLTARFARRFNGASVQLFERLYGDDWGLFASTSEARYLWDLSERLVFWLSARWHVQTGVFFWDRAYTARFDAGAIVVPTYRSGDRELGPLLSAGAGAGLRWALGPRARRHDTHVSLQLDEMATSFRDTLYVDGRVAHLVVLQAETKF